MKVALFNSKPYDRQYFDKANQQFNHHIDYFSERLCEHNARLAHGYQAVCVFVNDKLNEPTLAALAKNGTKLIALRCAGFNNVDITSAERHHLTVVRVPAYSPHAVAEHTISLIMTLNRKVCRAGSRVKEGNFSLEGLMGFELNDKTAGVIGTGKIGQCVAKILHGFGCRILAHDVKVNPYCLSFGTEYVPIDNLLSESDIITLHCPLMSETFHLIDKYALEIMKNGVMLINTSRGGLVDTRAVINALKTGKVGYLGLDVYEEEADLFFEDLSEKIIQDDIFARLLWFPNVLITGHQGFMTKNAVTAIASTTLSNISDIQNNMPCKNRVTTELIVA